MKQIKKENINLNNGFLEKAEGWHVDEFGNKYHFVNERLHSVDNEPSMITKDGDKFWHNNGLRHREDKPAVELYQGNEVWYRNGLLHSLVGPAIMRNNQGMWHIEDIEITEKEFEKLPRNSENKVHSLEEIKFISIMSNEYGFYALNGKVVKKEEVEAFILDNKIQKSNSKKKIKL